MEHYIYITVIIILIVIIAVLGNELDKKDEPKTPRTHFWTYEPPMRRFTTPYWDSRTVSEITTEMLKDEERNDQRVLYFFEKIKDTITLEEYWQKHHRIHVRLSIKQTK